MNPMSAAHTNDNDLHRTSHAPRRLPLPHCLRAHARASSSACALKARSCSSPCRRATRSAIEKKAGNQIMTEMVPQGETVKNWTEMVTVQIFLNMRGVTPAQYRAAHREHVDEACTAASSRR